MALTPNSGFLGQVKSLAGPLTDVHGSDGRFSNLKTTNVEASSLSLSSRGVTENTLIAFGSTGFATAAVGSLTLNRRPRAAAASASTDPIVASLPAGAVITSVTIDNNGTTITSGGSATLAITMGAFNGAASTTPVAATAIAVANAATGAEVSGFGTAVGSAAVAPVAASVVPASPNNFLNVTVATAALTAGDLRVVVKYTQLA